MGQSYYIDNSSTFANSEGQDNKVFKISTVNSLKRMLSDESDTLVNISLDSHVDDIHDNDVGHDVDNESMDSIENNTSNRVSNAFNCNDHEIMLQTDPIIDKPFVLEQTVHYRKVLNIYQRLHGKQESCLVNLAIPDIINDKLQNTSTIQDRFFSFLTGETEEVSV